MALRRNWLIVDMSKNVFEAANSGEMGLGRSTEKSRAGGQLKRSLELILAGCVGSTICTNLGLSRFLLVLFKQML